MFHFVEQHTRTVEFENNSNAQVMWNRCSASATRHRAMTLKYENKLLSQQINTTNMPE